ncbi:hypothetical protein C8R30_11040 [Nitrosomonas nitrosa]|jgi:hypothetical protein|uniref:Uncharacterized protein n=1 Tax=Nitrosomonas nitrosa TaxID=52442 RepID=A0A1I4QJZ7_9PROT|nr:N-acetyltransferase [Nitrosomonas nitrosa]MCO6435433.1 hypothetical protein [Nitrosomonas nitrosa]PTQ98329.1 hypothetical protein C8R30_11040 [Nitrosomonas nitrosa]CAE6511867.1 conserved hypothetical protein [Nitrosomonas nitrosa]SFM40015.1 hypothetical protein SAMN05421880_11542 [Nitrosomonas nitrosa]HNP52058.1 hypothetical protein [Nitrosomonas nitrosa]
MMALFSNTVTNCKRISKALSQMGWINTGLLILNRLLAKMSNQNICIYKYYLIAQPVNSKLLLPPNRGKNIKIRLINKQDPVIQIFPRPLSVIYNRFEQGALCLAAFKDEKFIGFIWLILNPYQEDEVRARFIPLPSSRAAWDFDVYIVPEYRLGFTFLRLWEEANQLLIKNGIQWSCSRISAFNLNSLKSHAGFGTITLGQAIFFRVYNWQITFSSLHPYIHFSSHFNSFPKFYLNTQKLNNPLSSREKGITLE